jgi:hypothetical protein
MELSDITRCMAGRRHDIRHNDAQHNDTQHHDTQEYALNRNPGHNDIQHLHPASL